MYMMKHKYDNILKTLEVSPFIQHLLFDGYMKSDNGNDFIDVYKQFDNHLDNDSIKKYLNKIIYTTNTICTIF